MRSSGWPGELEGYEDVHASARMRRDILRSIAPVVIEEAQAMRRVNKDQRARLRLTLNGRKMSAEAEPRMLLSDFLRHCSARPAPMSDASMASAAAARC